MPYITRAASALFTHLTPGRAAGAACTLCIACSLAGAPRRAAAAPGDLLWWFQGIENINAMVETIDIDGDLTTDVAIETYDAGAPSGGHNLYLLSGATGATIWSVRTVGGPSNSGGYGDDCLNAGRDMNGDGDADLLLGTAWGGRTAHGIDVRSGANLWSFDTYVQTPPVPPESGWIYSIHPVADLNGNLVDDAIFGAGSYNDGAYAVDGQDGSVIFRLDALDAIVSSTTPGDVTGDGLAEVVFGGGDNEHRVFCVSGASQGSASLLWTTDVHDGTQHMTTFIDVNGDTYPEILVGTWDYEVRCLSGADGTLLWVHALGVANVVMRVAPIDDVSSDGVADVAVASWDTAARVISGSDGSLIWRTPLGNDVWAIDRAADVTGDGISEVVAGCFNGRAYLLDGVDGSVLWSYLAGDKVMTVRGVGDLSGNGVPDVVAGTQMLSSSGGRVYALEGNDATPVGSPLVAARSLRAGIEITWETGTLRPGTTYSVYRRALDGGDAARGGASGAPARARQKAALARSDRPAREKLALALELGGEQPFVRLNQMPLVPDGLLARFLDTSARAGEVYAYRVGYVEPGSTERFLPAVTTRAANGPAGALAIRAVGAIEHPSGFRVTLPPGITGDYRVAVYGVGGRLARVVDRGRLSEAPGDLEIAWDGRDGRGAPLATGVYIAAVEAGGGRATAKLLWLR